MFLAAVFNTCFALGVGVLGVATYRILKFISLFFSIPGVDVQLQQYKHVVNSGTVPQASSEHVHWAIITGSSGGIGFGYAQYLLQLHFGVIILAHVESEVKEAEAKLRKMFPDGNIKSVVMDCQRASTSEIESLVSSLRDLSVTILVNNVGGIPMAHPIFRSFVDFEAHDIENHFNMNAGFMTQLTRLMLPHLIRNAHPRALILNITSGARIGLPYLSMYCATKGYVSSFSHALSRELEMLEQPVDCLLIIPADVASDGNRLGVQPGSPVAKDYARTVLERVNGAVGQGRLEISPYWRHALQIGTLDWLPSGILAKELARISILKKDLWAEEEEKKQKMR